MKNISVFGSTGSIGKSTLKIIEKYNNLFNVNFLSAYSNIDLLIKQIEIFKPKFVSVTENHYDYLKKNIRGKVNILVGKEGLVSATEIKDTDLIVMGISGISALKPTYNALRKSKTVALANKESIVSGGEFLKDYMENIIPVDSEHSSLFQLMRDINKDRIKAVYLTASGGPFLHKKIDKNIRYEDVLNHPVWSMGKKITVDSATMANKSLEIIEAFYLFGMEPEKIKVIIHPQSIVHSLIEFYDGVFFSQMSNPDMMYPISYALFYPDRAPDKIIENNIFNNLKIEFEQPDIKKFPFLEIAYDCITHKDSRTIVFNALNDEAVNLFLNKKIRFKDIFDIVIKYYEKENFERLDIFDKIFEIYNGIKKKVKSEFGDEK